jgi:lysophospholipase L1-like esterase
MKKMMFSVVVLAMSAGWSSSAQSSAQQLPDCPDLVRALQDVVRADARVREFANLRRYRDQNAALKPGQSRVVFMGDSITDLWAQPRFGGFFPGKPYVDRGISGQTTPQMLLRFRQDVIALRPEVVVILAGTNDVAGNTGPAPDEEIEGNLTSMCELATANHIRVVLSSITPVSDYHRRPPAPPMTTSRPPARIVALNTWIRAYAADHHHVYLDYYKAMVDEHGVLRAELSEDDLHPNEKGYAVMAPLADAAVQRALSSTAAAH